MLLQTTLAQRIIVALIVQIWPIFYGSFLAYKILKRARNKSTYTLSIPFILTSVTYFFATISILFLNTPLAYILYIIGIYFYVLCHCFLVILSWVLIKLDEKSPNWKLISIIIFYGLISSYVFILGYFGDGIMYNISTNWIPTYSWSFMIFSWVLLFIIVIIPQIYFSYRLLKVFEGIILRRRINLFIASVFLELFAVFSIFLYNTWVDNQIYRTVFILIMPAASTVAAFLIYKSFGKELE